MDANRSQSSLTLKQRAALLAAASLPFVLSLGFHLAGPKASEPQPAADRPALVFNQYFVDLGPRPPEPTMHAFFGFRNRGNAPVKIIDIETSCGCMISEFQNNKREYAPGEEGKFFLTVKTTREMPGPKEYFAKLRYEDPQPREIDVSFRCVLPEQQVRVSPPATVVYQPNTHPTSKEFHVTDNRRKPLRVLDVSSSADYIAAKIGDIESDEDGPRRTIINVTVETNVPPGRHDEMVTLLTDDPKFQQIPIYVRVEGSAPDPAVAGAPGAVRFEPEMLKLHGSRDQAVDSQVILIDEREKPFHPTSVISTSPAVQAHLEKGETDPAGHTRWRIAVTGVPGLPPGNFRSMIKVRTNDPNYTEVAVPVQFVVPDSTGKVDRMVVPASGMRPASP